MLAATPMVSFRPSVEGAWHTRAAESTDADAHGPGRLAGHVVRLVGDAPAGEVERRCGRRRPGAMPPARASRASSQRDAVEPGSPRRRRIGWARRPSPRSSAGAIERRASTSASSAGSNGVGGVELEQPEAGGAQVHAVDGPVVQAGHAEGAPVAHALGEDLPGVLRVAPVVPRHLDHLAVVVGLLLADAVGRRPTQRSGCRRLTSRSPAGLDVEVEGRRAGRSPPAARPRRRAVRTASADGALTPPRRPRSRRPTPSAPSRSWPAR